MKAFIFGMDKPLAKYLLEELKGKGHDVFGTANKPDKLKTFKIDLLKFTEIENLLDRLQPNIVFDLETSEDEENKEITKNILDAAEELDKSPSVILLSTAEVYGKPKFLPIPEEHPLLPVTAYGREMVQAENLARDSAKKGFRVIISRVFGYVPGESANGHKIFDLIDAKDLARGLIIAGEKGESGEAYNICSGNAYEIDEKHRIKRVKADNSCLIGDNRKFFRKTGWRPLVDIEQP